MRQLCIYLFARKRDQPSLPPPLSGGGASVGFGGVVGSAGFVVGVGSACLGVGDAGAVVGWLGSGVGVGLFYPDLICVT